ncbi:MAG: acyl carrier protein [Candidatus Omnitrophica bacterium]|nr:acyl carrier protein [Candidatus Omnitrophota bacterium]
MAKPTEKDVLNIIQSALNLKNKSITINSSISNTTEWDSLGHLSILSTLDKLFKGKIGKIKELAAANSVKKIIQLLKNNKLM